MVMRYHTGMKQKLLLLSIITTFALASFAPLTANAQSLSAQGVSLIRIVLAADLPIVLKTQLIRLVLTNFTTTADDNMESDGDTSKESDSEDGDALVALQSRGVSVIDASEGDGNEGFFVLTFALESFGSDIYVSQDLETSFEFDILDRNGDKVADENDLGSIGMSGSVTSDADDEGGYYAVLEDDSEQFTVRVVYEPGASGYYQLRINELHYGDEAEDPTASYELDDRYFTSNPIYIND